MGTSATSHAPLAAKRVAGYASDRSKGLGSKPCAALEAGWQHWKVQPVSHKTENPSSILIYKEVPKMTALVEMIQSITHGRSPSTPDLVWRAWV